MMPTQSARNLIVLVYWTTLLRTSLLEYIPWFCVPTRGPTNNNNNNITIWALPSCVAVTEGGDIEASIQFHRMNSTPNPKQTTITIVGKKILLVKSNKSCYNPGNNQAATLLLNLSVGC